MLVRTSKSYTLGAVLVLALSAPVTARSNLNAQPTDSSMTVMLSPANAAALEASLRPEGLYVSPLGVPAAAFRDDGFQPETSFFSFSNGRTTGTSAAYGCLMAPANLSDGVEVTDMFVSVIDNDVVINAEMSLWKVDNFTGATTLMAFVSSTGMPGEAVISTSDITDPVVSHPDDSVYLTTCVQDIGDGIVSARIYFDN